MIEEYYKWEWEWKWKMRNEKWGMRNNNKVMSCQINI